MENVTLTQKEQARLQVLNSLLAEHMTPGPSSDAHGGHHSPHQALNERGLDAEVWGWPTDTCRGLVYARYKNIKQTSGPGKSKLLLRCFNRGMP